MAAFLALSADFASGAVQVLASVSVVSPVNVVITNLSAGGGITAGSQVTIYMGMKNEGEYAATNIMAGLYITGPTPFNGLFPVPSLLPGQSSNVSIALSGFMPAQGAYAITANATYPVDGVTNSSNAASSRFTASSPASTVSAPPPSVSGGVPGEPAGPQVTAVPGITLSTIPIADSVIAGQGLSAQIEVNSTSGAGQRVEFAVNGSFSRLLSLSQSSVYLPPGGNASVQAVFRSERNTTPGTYIIPITINTTTAGSAGVSKTEYLEFTVYSNNPGIQILGQVYLLNYSRLANGVIDVINSGNRTVENATLLTVLPLQIAKNASQIRAYGLPNNISAGPDGYTISWRVSSLLPGQQLYAYYEVYSPQNVNLLIHPQNIFAQPSRAQAQSVLREVGISAPTFYPNATGYIDASILYTGVSPGAVSMYLSGPPNADILAPSFSMNVTPNQVVSRKFYVQAGNYTGTLLFYLYVSSGQYNQTYQVPIVVIPALIGSAGALQKTAQEAGTGYDYSRVLGEAAGAAVFLALLAAFIFIMRRRSRPKYTREQGAELARLRERIRGESNE